jgi:soluble lytic murein transglycosylase
MQLIPATAKAMARDLGLDSTDIAKKLFQVDVNVELGAQYLKKLTRIFKNDELAIIAAYNAGEFVVEKWIANRAHKDPYVWLELIPFQETRQYVTAVLHNYYLYKFLKAGLGTVVLKRSIDYKNRAQLFYREGRGL